MSNLVLAGVRKSFGAHEVLTGLDLEVAEGSLTAILGPSGSGKTTLLRIVAGFERADGGSVAIGDRVVDDTSTYVPPEARGIGYVPQEGSLFPHLTVAKNVAFGLDRQARRSRRVDELLEMVGLEGMGERFAHQLSGGQQQRVALARALAVRPALILLDEPFSSLDASLRAAVRADVRTVLRRAGTTALLVTHDQDEALSWADHVAVIRRGRIGQMDTPRDLYARPSDPELARFLGETNIVAGVRQGGSVRTVLGSLPVGGDGSAAGAAGDAGGAGEGGTAVVLIRPEQLVLCEPGSGVVRARVREYQYFGHDAVVELEPLAAGAPPTLVARTVGSSGWDPGAEVGVRVVGPVLAWDGDAVPDVPSPRGGEKNYTNVLCRG